MFNDTAYSAPVVIVIWRSINELKVFHTVRFLNETILPILPIKVFYCFTRCLSVGFLFFLIICR